MLNINTRSENRVAPPCIYYERCGGCQLQHLSYEAQLEMKKEQVINLFQRKAHFDNSKINDTVGMTYPGDIETSPRFQLVRMNRMKLLWAFIVKEAMTLLTWKVV